jgi:hypothetical protein
MAPRPLLKQNFTIQVSIANQPRQTPLVSNGDLELVLALIKAGVDVKTLVE